MAGKSRHGGRKCDRDDQVVKPISDPVMELLAPLPLKVNRGETEVQHGTLYIGTEL
jgi:hypothetical protein